MFCFTCRILNQINLNVVLILKERLIGFNDEVWMFSHICNPQGKQADWRYLFLFVWTFILDLFTNYFHLSLVACCEVRINIDYLPSLQVYVTDVTHKRTFKRFQRLRQATPEEACQISAAFGKESKLSCYSADLAGIDCNCQILYARVCLVFAAFKAHL